MITRENMEPNRVIIDDFPGDCSIGMVDFGGNAGITVQPRRGLTPQDAAKILKDCDLMINR
jgi:predicted metal-dependent TIM-barrel fold hydrolase